MSESETQKRNNIDNPRSAASYNEDSSIYRDGSGQQGMGYAWKDGRFDFYPF